MNCDTSFLLKPEAGLHFQEISICRTPRLDPNFTQIRVGKTIRLKEAIQKKNPWNPIIRGSTLRTNVRFGGGEENCADRGQVSRFDSAAKLLSVSRSIPLSNVETRPQITQSLAKCARS